MLQSNLKDKIKSTPFYVVITVTAYLTTFVSLQSPIQSAFQSGNKILGCLYVFFYVFVLLIGFSLRPKRKIKLKYEKSKFNGAGNNDEMDIWPRSDDEKDILEIITSNSSLPIILVGASGVGKSVIVNKRILPLLEESDWRSIMFNNYSSFKANFHKKMNDSGYKISDEDLLDKCVIGQSNIKGKLLIIFDQFEQFLSEYMDKGGDEHEIRCWFRKLLINSTKSTNIKFLIIVRKEWYYDLRFLDNFVPPPIKSIHLNGFTNKRNESGHLILKSKFEEAAQVNNVDFIWEDLEEGGEILPIQAQIIGLMIENESKKIGAITKGYYTNELGSKENLIRRYLKSYIDSSPDKDISMKVLFALSIEKRMRKQMSIPLLSVIIHKKISDINTCISYFVEEGLIRKTDSGQIELYHDYLAEKFHELSGSELDPVERDNILYFYDYRRRNKKYESGTRVDESNSKLILSDYFLIFLIALLLIRILSPMYGANWEWFSELYSINSTQKILDIYFIPVFVAHFAWSIYVTMLYRRYFSMLKENIFAKFLSKFTLINTSICVIVAIFIPHYFILSIGLAGLVIGIKFLQLSFKTGLNNISVNFFRSMAYLTIINMVVVSFIGIAVIYWFSQSQLTVDNQIFIIALYFLSMVLTYFMLAIRGEHISRNAASKMLGLIDRVS